MSQTLVPLKPRRPKRGRQSMSSPSQGRSALHTRGSDGLLERDRVIPGNPLDLDGSLAEGGDAQALIGQQPGVEGGERLEVGNLKLLANIDRLKSVGSGGREVDFCEGSVGLEVLKVHDTGEGGNIGVNAAVGRDGAVDGHVQ